MILKYVSLVKLNTPNHIFWIRLFLNHSFGGGWLRRVLIPLENGGARGVMVILVGNGHGDTSSNPRRD